MGNFSIVGVDAGNNEVKVYGEHGYFKFDSCLSEYRELRLKDPSAYEPDEYLMWEHDGRRGFGGLLALKEGRRRRKRGGDTKAHIDFQTRVLLALHRYAAKYGVEAKFKVVVGQPIEQNREPELEKMKSLLKTKHKFSVNDDFRELTVQDAKVAPEGCAAFWANPTDGKVRILDFGSGTVNAATLNNKRYVDAESFTVTSGIKPDENNPDTEIDSNTIHDLVGAVVAECVNHGWGLMDNVKVAGGAAKLALPILQKEMPNATAYQPTLKNGDTAEIFEPVYANAIGLYNLARGAFA
jgi:plasmid segregation protein ParM